MTRDEIDALSQPTAPPPRPRWIQVCRILRVHAAAAAVGAAGAAYLIHDPLTLPCCLLAVALTIAAGDA